MFDCGIESDYYFRISQCELGPVEPAETKLDETITHIKGNGDLQKNTRTIWRWTNPVAICCKMNMVYPGSRWAEPKDTRKLQEHVAQSPMCPKISLNPLPTITYGRLGFHSTSWRRKRSHTWFIDGQAIMWMKLKMNESCIITPLRRGLENIQRGKIFARDRAVSAEPGHLFYGKGKVPWGGDICRFLSNGQQPGHLVRGLEGRGLEGGRADMWMNMWEWALSVKSFVLHVNGLQERDTENPGLYLDYLQPIPEHSGTAWAGPFLLNTGLLCQAYIFCAHWLWLARLQSSLSSPYWIMLSSLFPFIGFRPVLWPKDSPTYSWFLWSYPSHMFTPVYLLYV